MQVVSSKAERHKPSYCFVTPFWMPDVYLRSIEPLIAIVLG
jgi:hypothetical protein